MIDLVNSSPNMGTFCHRERNLEFCSWKIWIWTICLTRHFTLFKTFPFGLLLVLGSGRILGILSSFAIWGRVGGMVVCGSEPAGQRLSIEGELAVIQEPALAQTARPIHIWYIYYWDHAPQYIIDTTHHHQLGIYLLNILPWRTLWISSGSPLIKPGALISKRKVANVFVGISSGEDVLSMRASSLSVSSAAPQQVCQRAPAPFPGKDCSAKRSQNVVIIVQ